MSPSQNSLSSTTGLSESERHLLLSAERRRIALSVLEDRADPMDLEALAAAVAARADDDGEDAVDRTMIDLHHSHLPRMDDLGVVDYDRDSGEVR